MICKIFLIFAFLLSLVNSDEYHKEYEKHDDGHHDEIDYKFYYDVKDDHHYNYQTRDEKKEGKNIYGSYSVLEPDGRTRIVKYVADEHGFHAVVNHEGYKKEYDYKPQYHQSHYE